MKAAFLLIAVAFAMLCNSTGNAAPATGSDTPVAQILPVGPVAPQPPQSMNSNLVGLQVSSTMSTMDSDKKGLSASDSD
jgi:hypothetical protein